jgi:hypothetical protein
MQYAQMSTADKRRVRSAMLVESMALCRKQWPSASALKIRTTAYKIVNMALAKEKRA